MVKKKSKLASKKKVSPVQEVKVADYLTENHVGDSCDKDICSDCRMIELEEKVEYLEWLLYEHDEFFVKLKEMFDSSYMND